MTITVMSVVAQSESVLKSNSIKWAYKKRFANGLGIHPNWSLLGYKAKTDWEIIEEEADVVRAIYRLYLEGYSSSQIAEILTKNDIPTVRGKSVWNAAPLLIIYKICSVMLKFSTGLVSTHTKYWLWIQADIPTAIRL